MPQTIRRVSLDDVLPDPATAHDARAVDALRRVAVALDQVVNRAHDESCRFGRHSGADSAENRGDFAECERLVGVLDAAAAAARAMLDGVRSQFGVAPAPAAEPPPPPKAPAKAR